MPGALTKNIWEFLGNQTRYDFSSALYCYVKSSDGRSPRVLWQWGCMNVLDPHLGLLVWAEPSSRGRWIGPAM